MGQRYIINLQWQIFPMEINILSVVSVFYNISTISLLYFVKLFLHL